MTAEPAANPDPYDLITWVQYKAALKIATAALYRIAYEDANPGMTASLALNRVVAEVKRFDESEPSLLIEHARYGQVPDVPPQEEQR